MSCACLNAARNHTSSGPELPGISCHILSQSYSSTHSSNALAMQMLLPFSSVWLSVVFFRPCGVVSLRPPREYMHDSPYAGTHYSVTSSKTMSIRHKEHTSVQVREKRYDHSLTKSSKPSSVPVNSLSFFMMTHIREPMHLSINSGLHQSPASVSLFFIDETHRAGGFGKPCRASFW